MKLKTHSKYNIHNYTSKRNNSFGFTLIELLISVGVLLIISSVLFISFRPDESKKKARDNVRLANIADIERVVNEYMLDNRTYPGDPNVLYKSTSVNWIPSPLSKYTSKIPVDPLNNGTYFYYYMHDGSTYEVVAILEYFTNLMTGDNGNQLEAYEVGNNLNLISNN